MGKSDGPVKTCSGPIIVGAANCVPSRYNPGMATPGANADSDVFLFPDLGEGLDEAELVEWKCQPGDTVQELDIIAMVETAKALTEVTSPKTAVVAKLHADIGDIIEVGKPLVTFEPKDGAKSEAKSSQSNGTAAKAQQDADASQPKPTDAATGAEGVTEPAVARDVADDVAEHEAEEQREDAGTVVGKLSELPTAGDGKILAAPAVRALARDLGVDLSNVTGTGLGGRIVAGDVKQAASSGGSGTTGRPAPSTRQAEPTRPAPMAMPSSSPSDLPKAPQSAGETTSIPFRGIRRTIAAKLRSSVDNAVHFTVMDEANVADLDAFRKRFIKTSGDKMSLLPFVCTAVVKVIGGQFGAEFNKINARTNEDISEIIQYRDVHLGIATDTDNGLMVPVIHNAQNQGLSQMARSIAGLASSARDRTIGKENLEGSTFTVSNFGSYAGRFATPVINYPEAGILAVGRAREGAVVKNGMIGAGLLLPLSLTCDHRIIDGGTATRTLNKIIELLQNPEMLFPDA